MLASRPRLPVHRVTLSSFDIRVVDLTFLRGPNRWSYRPALEALVDIGELEEWPSSARPDVVEALTRALPGLHNHGCSYEEPGGFVRRLEEGTWPAHILEHVTLELMELSGHRVGFGRARSAAKKGYYHVVVRSPQNELTEAAFKVARRFLVALYNRQEFELDAELKSLGHLSRQLSPSAAVARLRAAAERARIPAQCFESSELLVLGQGARQRRIWQGATDSTSAIADGIARDKALLHEQLREAGIPTAWLGTFDNESDLAEEAKRESGPFVVKPARSTAGRGVSLAQSTAAELERAARLALEFDSTILLERQVAGMEFEVLVVAGRVLAASGATPIRLLGDGLSTLRELLRRRVEQLLFGAWQVPSQEYTELILQHPLVRIELKRAAKNPDEILLKEDEVLLTLPASIAGARVNVVHESITHLATTAARVVGLDVATVAVIAEDLSRPLASQSAAVIGVAAAPSWLSHLPERGSAEDPLADAILEHLLPVHEGARINVSVVTGGKECDAIVDLLSWFLRVAGHKVGLSDSHGVRVNERSRSASSFQAIENLIFSRAVDQVVFHAAIPDVLQAGLACDRSRVSIVTSFASELNHPGLEAEGASRHLLRTLVDIVLPDGAAVLNADESGPRSLAEYCDGEVIFYGTHKSDSFLEEHALAGGRSVTFRSGKLVLRSGNFVLERPVSNQIEAAVWLPAFAAALKLNLSPELLIGALHSKTSDSAAPSRQAPKVRASRPDL